MKIICDHCKAENSIENNFCYNCGFKLESENKNSFKKQEFTQQNTSSKYEDIRENLVRLIDHNGSLIISIGDFYVQFDKTDNKLLFEAVSDNFIPEIGGKDDEFNSLNFIKEENHNYSKFLKNSEINVEQLLSEIEEIFENIYKVPLVNYSIGTDFVQEEDKKDDDSGNGCLGFILIVAVVFGLYVAFSGDDSNTSKNQSDVVKNSSFDGSVHQVEDFLKENYLKDPNSYESIEWSPVQDFENNPNYTFMVRHKFRAKNSFGGYVVENMVFYLNSNGEVIDYRSIN